MSITLEEQLSGWFSMLRSAKMLQQIETAHFRLCEAVRSLSLWDVLPFTVNAIVHFQELLRQRLNVGGNDLRIGAIALEAGAVIVRRNLRDYRRIPNIRCEDWSV